MLLSLSQENLIHASLVIIREFNPKKIAFLDSMGQWKENPETMKDRISNELLYSIWKLEGEGQTSFIQNLFSLFKKDDTWLFAKKIKLASLRDPNIKLSNMKEVKIDRAIIHYYSQGSRSNTIFPFLIILEALGAIIEYEAIRMNCELFVPEWNFDAKARQQKYIQNLKFLNKFLIKVKSHKLIFTVVKRLNRISPEIIKSIPHTIGDEDRLINTINHLLEKEKNPFHRREEIYSSILETLRPPMGIVTEVSPALLRICLRLLMDDKIEINSGVQYYASLILSILQDSRSIETLLKAIEKFPLYYSKIRENIIYTLGNLKEKRAVGPISKALEGPDELAYCYSPEGRGICLLIEQKAEAILALGRIGLDSIIFLPVLIKYAEHPSSKLKTYLAWTLGEIGKAQKEKTRGVSVDIIITLLKLLRIKDKQVFEESISSLKKIDMPEFIHSLYLYNVGAVNILGLKPSQKGLYELSETVHFLIKTKRRAIIAINGDSGTGKTYFCRSIINGFGNVRPEDILYLMRDRKKDQKIFNRILGLKWLKKNINPIYYNDYPLSEKEDNPDEFLSQFLEKNSHKKLIILDGCRDQHYFQRVIDLFYFRGSLDVVMNFRTTFSTRRMNLEEREIALESIKTHLSFIEELPIEDTLLYQKGKVILYDLDNSIGSRLNNQETKELFDKIKIDSWGDLIRIGDFKKHTNHQKIRVEKLAIQEENFTLKTENLPSLLSKPFHHEERKFYASLNENPIDQPNLLQTIEMEDLKPTHIRFYAQEQIAGIGEEGSVFVLTFLDNRIFYTFFEKNTNISLLGRDIFLINDKGGISNISFERTEITNVVGTESPALALTSLPRDTIITGHMDGTIRIWNFANKNIQIIEGHQHPVISLSVDHFSRIFSLDSENILKQWDIERQKVKVIENLNNFISFIKLYTSGKLLVITGNNDINKTAREKSASKIRIIDFGKRVSQVMDLPFNKAISSINVYFDGRIIAGLHTSKSKNRPRSNNLAIISLKRNFWEYKLLQGHKIDTKDCLATGPKIITCGIDGKAEHSIRFWGTESYVKLALSKLSLKPS